MQTAIIINLDYENQPSVKCRQLWTSIEARMMAAGFIKSSRRFLTNAGCETASKLAKDVMDGVDAEYRKSGQTIGPFIRDFFCIPCDKIIDLLPAPVHAIEVDLMATGAFDRFFK